MNHFPRLLIVMTPLLLAACSNDNVRDTLGLNRDAPDEFTVLSRPPLSMPPEFTLLPPSPGAAPLMPSPEEQAREAIVGGEAKSAVGKKLSNPLPEAKQATDSFLKHAGAEGANTDIRSELGKDATTPADTSKARTLLEKLSGSEKKEPVVDPKKEAERLRANKDAGKPVTEGDVPVQEEKPASLLDRIF